MVGFIENELGFISCNAHTKSGVNNNELVLEAMTVEELKEHNKEMEENGYIPNYELDCYIVDEYGAWMGYIKGIEEFEQHFGHFMEKGYDLIIKPVKSKGHSTKYNVFCRNYHTIYIKNGIEIQKQLKKRIFMD